MKCDACIKSKSILFKDPIAQYMCYVILVNINEKELKYYEQYRMTKYWIF